MESLGEMEAALQFYEMAQDYLSLVRVYCYCSNMEKVGIWEIDCSCLNDIFCCVRK